MLSWISDFYQILPGREAAISVGYSVKTETVSVDTQFKLPVHAIIVLGGTAITMGYMRYRTECMREETKRIQAQQHVTEASSTLNNNPTTMSFSTKN